MKKLYKIGPLHDGTHKGLRIHWQQDIYFHAIHLPKLQEILKKHVGNDMTIPNMERVNQDLHQFFNSIKRDMYLSEEYVPYSMNPYILLQKGKEEIYRYQPPYGGIAVSTVKKETQLDKVEKKVDRLAKQIGKLTNELKKANKGNEKKSSDRTLNDLPEAHFDYRDIYQLHPAVEEKLFFKEQLDKVLEERGRPPKQLQLVISANDCLLLAYNRGTTANTLMVSGIVGHINSKGEMHILNTENRRSAYKEWKTTPGHQINSTNVYWKTHNYFLYRSDGGGDVFLARNGYGKLYNITEGIPVIF